MKKFTNIVGAIFGIIGLSLLAYSSYLYFFLPIKQDLVQILPLENFEFIAFGTNNETSANFAKLQKNISFYLPQNNETVVSYLNKNKNQSEFIIISKIDDNTENKKLLLCAQIKKYDFCTSKENTQTLSNITNFVNSNSKKTISQMKVLHDNSISDLSFFGTTSFFIKNLDAQNTYQDIKKLLILAQDNLLYFSGDVIENNKIVINFHKNTTFTLNTNAITQAFNIDTIVKKTENYLYISQPQAIINLIHNNKISKNFVNQTSEYKKFQDIFTDMFQQKITYFNDIEPLLNGNIIITDNFIAIALPSEKISQIFYERYLSVLKEISKETIPEKKCFEVNNTNSVCEIFPSKKNVQIIEKNNYAEFITTKKIEETDTDEKPSKEKISKKSLMRIHNILFISNSTHSGFDKLQNQTITTNQHNTIFIFKNNTLKISGIEQENSLVFTGKFSENSSNNLQ
ncbi:TPA: hypothetical protein EYG96_01205 [Candidatus Gracilibacteria bacterium]|nr:hypothetical protein [Candidatus Gracilibacteria bacterium]